ncbi:MAG: hypothetical protein RJB66_2758, partial [Pseudomonadota bacterium]
MKTLLAILMVLGTPFVAQAQVDDSFDLELDPVISEDIKVGDSPGRDQVPSSSLESKAHQNRSIYIVNQASSGAKAAAKTEQNETDITNSRAADLKKSRHRAEVETELRASEKIEEARLNDERRRSEVLFGERYRELEDSGRVTPRPVVIPVQEVREEVRTIVKEAEVVNSGTPPTSSYAILLAGLSQFPRAENIQGNGVLGIGLGIETQANFLVEGMFQYGSYHSTFPWPSQIFDYSGAGSMKYQFGSGTIIPIVGATLVYSYRTYYDNFSFQGRQSYSSVLDAGVIGGAEFTINRSFSLGAEFRYLWNITSQTDGYYTVFFPNQAPLDTFSHYILALTGRYNF